MEWIQADPQVEKASFRDRIPDLILCVFLQVELVSFVYTIAQHWVYINQPPFQMGLTNTTCPVLLFDTLCQCCGLGSTWIRIIFGIWIRIRTHIRVKAGSALKSKVESLRGSKSSRGGPWTLTMEAWKLKIEPWRVCRPLVADSYHFDEELDPDPDPHWSETGSGSWIRKLDPDPH